MKDSFICICCRRRLARCDAKISEEFLGLCKHCDGRIKYTGYPNLLPAKGSTSALFTPLYYKRPIKGAITRFKFMHQTRYEKIFTEILYDYLKNWNLRDDFDFITAIPISRKRYLERGYNQTDVLARPLAERLGMEYNGNCIYKKRHNKRQSKLRSATLRFENVQDAYLADNSRVLGKKILLMDDIYTTGATMESCAAELLEKGAKEVVGVTLAAVIR